MKSACLLTGLNDPGVLMEKVKAEASAAWLQPGPGKLHNFNEK